MVWKYGRCIPEKVKEGYVKKEKKERLLCHVEV